MPVRFVSHQVVGEDVTSRDLQLMQTNLSRALDPITSQATNGGVLIKGVSLLAASTTLVAHGLGQRYTTWWPCGLQANATVYEDTTSTADRSQFLPLKTSANVTCDIRVCP